MSTPFTPANGGGLFVSPGSGSDSFSTSSDQSRTLPRQLSTGTLRGTQNVGYGGVKIDGSSNRIVLGSTGQSVGDISATVGNIVLDGNNSEIDVSGANSKITISSPGSSHPVISIGEYTDHTFNFRVQDVNGVGIAQFGQFPNGSIALKVAQAGIEVSTATPQQLVFSSSASFTVALQNSYTFASLGSVPDGGTANSGTITIPHNVGFIPGVNCFAPLTVGGYSFSTVPTGFPIGDITLFPSGNTIQQGDAQFFNFYYAVDATNLYLGLTFANSSGAPVVALAVTVYYTVFTLHPTTPIA